MIKIFPYLSSKHGYLFIHYDDVKKKREAYRHRIKNGVFEEKVYRNISTEEYEQFEKMCKNQIKTYFDFTEYK